MEIVDRKRKCLRRKNPQKPHKQSTQLKVSQIKFARSFVFDEVWCLWDLKYGAAYTVLDNICSKEVLEKDIKCFVEKRGGRPSTSISSPNHIFIIFSSEPHRNPCPFNIIFLSVWSLKINTFFKNMATLGHKTWLE